jgi:hypothetical protein
MVTTNDVMDWLVHAHIECRTRGGTWWRFARPALAHDARLMALLAGLGDPSEDLVGPLGMPTDLSPEVRDDFTWLIVGEFAYAGDSRTVPRTEAEQWVTLGRSMRWPTAEPFTRITDPAWQGATWVDSRELDRVLRVFERTTGDLAPATYCALLAAMSELERDYDARTVMWFERTAAAITTAAVQTASRGGVSGQRIDLAAGDRRAPRGNR